MSAGELIQPPRGYCIGIFTGTNAAMVGPYATELEARDALSHAVISPVGGPAGWHEWCGAENGPLVCIRPQGHDWTIGHDNGGVWWPATPVDTAAAELDDLMALQSELARAMPGQAAGRCSREGDAAVGGAADLGG